MTGTAGSVRTLGHVLGEFVAGSVRTDVDGQTRARAAQVLLDCLGVTLAGRAEPVACAVVDVDEAGRAEATLLGTAERLPAAAAALANGTAAHALDYDDVQQPWYGHPTAVLFPTALALAERGRLPGRTLVSGYLVGLAVGDALGAALNTAHYDAGWHPTATLGTLAAAATTSHLLGASAEEATSALGIAASTAAGLRVNFGTDVKAVHAGLAARNGITAALMARRGVRASGAALDGRFGFAPVLGGGSVGTPGEDVAAAVRDRLADGLAAPLRRIGLKQYPACAATNPTVDAVLSLRRAHGLRAEAVASVECVVEPLATTLLTFARPATPQEARFSLQHCVAAALLDGELGLRQFEQQRLAADDVRSLEERVRVVADPSIRATGDFPSTVTITLTDGGVLREHVPQAVGKPLNPMTEQDVVRKFRMLTGGGTGDLARAGEGLLRIEDCDDVTVWTGRLRTAVAAPSAR